MKRPMQQDLTSKKDTEDTNLNCYGNNHLFPLT
jgi:hypothetical protein